LSRSGIISAGNWIVDRVKYISHYPEVGTLVSILSESLQNGGAPFNLLVDLSKLGANFNLKGVGVIGDDKDGFFVLSECLSHGIEVSNIKVLKNVSTSYTAVMVDKISKQRTFFHNHGANSLLSLDDFNFKDCDYKHFHLGYLLLLDNLDIYDRVYGTLSAKVLCDAQKHNFTTSFDVVSESSDRFKSVVIPCLPYANIVFMNEYELSKTSGILLNENCQGEDVIKACKVLESFGMTGIAAIHTAKKAFVYKDGVMLERQACKVDVVGTVGAGDAFAAGFLLAFHEDKSLEECLRYAVASASSSLCGEGASNGIVTIEEALEKFSSDSAV
jgi:sugar/nucleoside kinase (ribokinase family)